MNGVIEPNSTPGDLPRPARPPIEFAGAIDARVVTAVHHLFKRKAKRRELWFLIIGSLSGAGALWSALATRNDPELLIDTLRLGITSFFLFSGWWTLRKGWARFMLDQVVTGRIHGVGIVVDQLDDRASWDEFCSVRLSDSSALLFVDEKEQTPQVLAFDGLPLHRSFFESEEEWQEVCQMIRERVRKVSLVAH